MRKLVLILIVLAASVSIYGSKKGHDGVEIDRPLTWKDFKGKANENISMKATTVTIIEYSIVQQPPNPKFKTTLYFDPKRSWVSKDFLRTADAATSADLLNHEQIHYDISRVISWELEQSLNSFAYDRGKIRYQVDSIYRSYIHKHHELQQRYDKETDHSRVADEQQRWNNIVAEALKNKTINL